LGETTSIRVLLADDHPLMRAGIALTLSREPDIELVGQAEDGLEARRLAASLRPDVLLLDVSMPGPRAADTVVHLASTCPDTRVLALTAYDDDVYVTALVEAGVCGYVLKDEAPTAMLRAVRAVAEGERWFSSSIAERLNRRRLRADGYEVNLTKRESEALRLVMEGLTDREVGLALGLSERTVRYHLGNVYSKLGVSARAEAVAKALELGLVRPRSEDVRIP
jgi:DNA-binding NarL/FixJ family response regulator